MSSRQFRMAMAASVAFLAACAQPGGTGGGARPSAGPGVFEARDTPPEAGTAGCWERILTPAVVETVTEQVMIRPAETGADGRILRPAVFKTETRQQILNDRSEAWIETPCPADVTPEFVASLQRALQARGLFRGAVTGTMDIATRSAIRRFQAPQGLDTGVLSLAAARQLGLAIDPRFAPDAG